MCMVLHVLLPPSLLFDMVCRLSLKSQEISFRIERLHYSWSVARNRKPCKEYNFESFHGRSYNMSQVTI